MATTKFQAASVFGKPPERIDLSAYQPHDGQIEVLNSIRKNFSSPNPAAIVEIIASRGWGKTLFTVMNVLVPFLNATPNARVMWVAPNYKIGLSPIVDVFKGVDELTGKRWVPEFDDKGNRIWDFANSAGEGPTLKWWNAGTVSIKSAEAAESIVSRGYHLIIIDEAAIVDELVFTQQIMGTARKAGIKIFMITSPRGKRHWTYKMYLKGQDSSDTNYLSFQQPYTKNPHFNPTLAKLIKDLPDWIYRQEYLAEFIEDGNSIIRGLEHITEGPEVSFESQQQEWEATLTDIVVKELSGDRHVRVSDRRFIVAMDLAKSVDFTVIWVMDLDNGQCVHYKRFNKTDYRQVLEIANRICKQYNHAELIFDSTGVGGGLADFLNNFDITAHPYVFTNDSKNDLVNRLVLAIEHQNVAIPNIPTVIGELSAFTYTLTKTGKMSYGAPSGYHDDIVMAFALANWYRTEHSVDAGQVSVIEEIINHNRGGSRRGGSVWDRILEDDD